MKDITFYDMNFNKIYILPQYSVEKGYISVNVEKKFCEVGSVEIVFIDETLKSIIKQNRDNLMLEWNGVQGILSAYRDEEKGFRITGETLNGLLKRVVIPQTVATQNSNVESIARSAIAYNAPWMVLGEMKGLANVVSFSSDTYKQADVYMNELLKLDNAGYEIKADFINKQFIFQVLESKESNLLLSTNNLNAYGFSEVYINRTIAHGGWYPKKVDDETEWTYITLDSSLSGVFKKDVVLKATTEDEARQELETMVADAETELKTRNVYFGKDYNLGDIVRVQNNDIAVQKRITSVIMSQENGYIENPIFSEVE